jgi:hypothetical protein
MTDQTQALPLPLDDLTLKKLLIIRQVFERGVAGATIDSPSARMLAVITFDFCVEMLLKTILSALRPLEKMPEEFPKLLGDVHKAIRDCGGSGSPAPQKARKLHELRNAVQHQGLEPSTPAVFDSHIDCDLLLREATWLMWEVDFSEIDLLNFVQTDRAREWLTFAKESMNEPPYLRSIAYSWRALSTAIDSVKLYVVGHTARRRVGIETLDDSVGNVLDYALYDNFILTQDVTLMLALGMDVQRFVRYREVIGELTAASDNIIERRYGKETLEEDDARFVYAFCVDSVSQIESRMGPLVMPSWRAFYPPEIIEL